MLYGAIERYGDSLGRAHTYPEAWTAAVEPNIAKKVLWLKLGICWVFFYSSSFNTVSHRIPMVHILGAWVRVSGVIWGLKRREFL